MSTTLIEQPISRRRFKYLLIPALFFVVTLGALYLFENWRGDLAWASFKLELRDRGFLRDWAEFIPPPVPDEENVFGVPGMQYYVKGATNASSAPAPGGLVNLSEMATNNVVVARLYEPTGAPDNAVIRTLPDAVSALERHCSKSLPGASGPAFIAPEMLQKEPLLIALPSSEQQALGEKFPLLKLLPGSEHAVLSLTNAVIASQYLAARANAAESLAVFVEALERPRVRIPGNYSGPFEIPVPNFVAVRSIAHALAQDAQSYLLLGQPDAALQRLLLCRKVSRLMRSGPGEKPQTLVEAMIDVAVHGLYISVVKDGFRLQQWGEPELARLSEDGVGGSMLEVVSSGLRAELTAVIHLAETRSFADLMDFSDIEGRKRIFNFLPRGWYSQNKRLYGDLMRSLISSIERNHPNLAPIEVDKAYQRVEHEIERSSPFVLLSRIAIPNAGKGMRTAARNEVQLRLIRIASALERFRIQNREYPETLEQLVPEFLAGIPRDVFGGGEFHYRPASDRYLLYSVGWNQKDDGGAVSSSIDTGDLVWTVTN